MRMEGQFHGSTVTKCFLNDTPKAMHLTECFWLPGFLNNIKFFNSLGGNTLQSFLEINMVAAFYICPVSEYPFLCGNFGQDHMKAMSLSFIFRDETRRGE